MPGSIAARVMAYQRRMSGTPGPMFAGGEASNGEPVQVELLISGVWTDITAYVMVRDDNGSISITRGRRDEGQTADHAVMNLLLDNRDGRFSPRNPTGTYYGLIGRNQPIRVSVPNGLGGKGYRFWGEVTVWPQRWDPTGTDVWVELEASGVIRRLTQAPPATYSPIRQAITDPEISGLRAYWPCEDADGVVEIASALTTGSPMVFSVAPALAASSLFGSSDPLPVFTDAAMTGGVAKYDDPSSTQVRFLLYIPPEGTTNRKTIVRVAHHDDVSVTVVTHWELLYNTSGNSLSLLLLDESGANYNDIADSMDVRGKLLRVSLEAQESGANTNYTLRVLDLTSSVESSATGTRNTEGITRVTSVAAFVPSISAVSANSNTGVTGGVIGHITVQDTVTDIEDLGIRLSPVGEAAGRRIQRVCAEEGIAFDWIGSLDETVALGGQGRSNMLELAREAELADGGMLYENLAVLGLGYRTRSSLCNQDPQLTLNYSGFNLSEVPLPVEDDRYVQNSVTVTVNGISQTYRLDEGSLSTEQPPAGVGLYGEEITLNLENTDTAVLLDQAAWRVHLGTVDELRYPQISVNLAHSSFSTNPALKQAVLGLRPGDRILVENPPSWLPPDDIDQIILGFEEEITHFEHRIAFICAPASPYRVGVLDDVAFRLDTEGSELLSDVTSGATSLVVVPSSGLDVLWTTDSAEAPWDIRVGGEVMTVTDVADWLTDAFGRTESNTWGTSDSGQAWSAGGGVAGNFNVASGYGSHTLSTTNASRRSFVDATFTDFDIAVSIAVSTNATGGSLFGGPTGRHYDSSNLYHARLEFTTTNGLILAIRKIVGGTESTVTSVSLTDPYVATEFIRVRFQGTGARLRAKAWLVTDLEPPFWHLSATDTSLTQAAFIGVRSISASTNTNVNPEVRYDNAAIVNPQTFTVTRSVNGVTKSHSAGADVRLAYPTILAL